MQNWFEIKSNTSQKYFNFFPPKTTVFSVEIVSNNWRSSWIYLLRKWSKNTLISKLNYLRLYLMLLFHYVPWETTASSLELWTPQQALLITLSSTVQELIWTHDNNLIHINDMNWHEKTFVKKQRYVIFFVTSIYRFL